MKKQTILKWALPALLASAMSFELIPGSVRCYAADQVAAPETVYNFFTLGMDSTGAACLPIAGMLTMVALLLSLVALFLKKRIYRLIGWLTLAGGAFCAVPYVAATAQELIQPNVVVLFLLCLCWGLAMYLDKQKAAVEEPPVGRRL